MTNTRAILFDLDGTLLPMDNDEFTKGYFAILAGYMAPHGYEPEALVSAVWAGTSAMVKNDGKRTNHDAFWQKFSEFYGEKAARDMPLFDSFYETAFQNAKALCGMNPLAAKAVSAAKERGFTVCLATNPVFPAVATHSRVRWAGLEPSDFALITTYENSSFCKPNPDYYADIAARLGVSPEQCLMVGNDVGEDMTAANLGMKVFLLTDCLINRKNADISELPRGGFEMLIDYIAKL